MSLSTGNVVPRRGRGDFTDRQTASATRRLRLMDYLRGDMRNDPTHSEIERLAYQLWQERGRPWGSAEEDWFRAERLLLSLGSASRHHSDVPITLPFSSIAL